MKDLPSRIKAMTVDNKDGTYTIFINSRLNLEQQQEGYIHELEHILSGDYERTDSNLIEFNAHKKTAPTRDRNGF
jgi:Zn-dependent peptidase ImmA (M78 family)